MRIPTLAAIAALAFPLLAQNPPANPDKLLARQLFYRVRNDTSPHKPLGLRYTVRRRMEDGRFEQVSPQSVFHSGDRIRLGLEVNDSGFLYLVNQGTSGAWKVLFPSPKINRGDNRVQAGQTYIVPEPYSITFTGKSGVEKLFVILTRAPEKEIDRLIKLAPLSNEVVDGMRAATRDLVIDTGEDAAVYVVNPKGTPDSRVVADIALTHE